MFTCTACGGVECIQETCCVSFISYDRVLPWAGTKVGWPVVCSNGAVNITHCSVVYHGADLLYVSDLIVSGPSGCTTTIPAVCQASEVVCFVHVTADGV